ncbi:MAG: hypothetical protein AAF513_10070 [Pseudomonadota bacterium]
MNEDQNALQREEIEEILAEEFNPELFYKALRNALSQLDQHDEAEAA